MHKTHWKCHLRIYRIYYDMARRCKNPNRVEYLNYWWRWIICEWINFEDFYNDMIESYLNHIQIHWEENTSIDRIDNDWNYCKENCKWSNRFIQWRNKRNNLIYEWKCLSEWCYDLWLNYKKIWQRVKRLNWSFEKSLELIEEYETSNQDK